MSHYFISDLHLQASREDIAEAFFSFVENTASDAESLYILGDFFDAWLGDDEDAPFYNNVRAKLKTYSQAGLALFFQHGNRDFLVGEKFARETGAILLAEEAVIELNGQSALLMHGDSLCIDDQEYMQFRAQVRNPAWQQQILSLPLQQRRVMAAQLRAQSQSMNAMKAEDIMDVNAAEVESALKRHELSILIHGHTHRPKVHRLQFNGKEATRYVLGDWDEKVWYIRANSDGLTLNNYPL